MIVKIDNRENHVIEYFNKDNFFGKNNITMNTSNLNLGDIQICENDEPIIIFERKTIKDLISSIKDGRYQEQSFRLNGCPVKNHNIVYVLEGNIFNYSDIPHDFNMQIFMSSLTSLAFYKGFSVIRTFNLEETCLMIMYMCKKIKKEGFEFEAFKQTTYCDVVPQVKKNNLNQNNISEVMLCCIPSVSKISVKCILNHYKNISNLIKELEQNPDCLESLYIESDKGKRKLSKNVISNIKKFLIFNI